MTEPKLLPVRLRPEPGEHFSAYLLRLAIANGRGSVRELFSTLKIKGPRAQNHQSSDNIATIAEWLGLSSDQLNTLIVKDETLAHVTPYDSMRIYRNLELRVPRVCTACLKDGRKIPMYFGHLPFTHCYEHGHELIHYCPHCNGALSWSEELLEGRCPSCELVLEDSTIPARLPAYAAGLHAQLSDPLGLNYFIRDLLLALQCVLDPMNSDLSARERPPMETGCWPDLLDQAYTLLTEQTTMLSWANACRNHRAACAAIGSSAVYLPIDALKSRLTLTWPLRDFECNSDHPHDEQNQEDSFSLTPVDHRQLSQVLGCEPAEIMALLEYSALQGYSGHRSVRDARFDLLALANQINDLSLANGASVQLIDMAHAARIAFVHGGHLGHVLVGILKKEIPFRPDSNRGSLLERGNVGLDGLLAWMHKHLASQNDTHFTLSQTIAITGMTEQEITRACALGLIKPLGWKRGLSFLGGDLSQLLADYVSIKRWSKISGIRAPLAELQASHFEAPIEGVLYRRTEELDCWLAGIVSR